MDSIVRVLLTNSKFRSLGTSAWDSGLHFMHLQPPLWTRYKVSIYCSYTESMARDLDKPRIRPVWVKAFLWAIILTAYATLVRHAMRGGEPLGVWSRVLVTACALIGLLLSSSNRKEP